MAEEITLAYLFRLILIGQIHGQTTQTQFHFSTRGEMSTKTPHEIAGLLMSHFATTMVDVIRTPLSQQWHLKSMYLTSMLPKSDVLFEVPFPVGTGGQAGDSLPSFNAFLLRHRTGVGGGSGSGASFLPGVPVDAVETSRVVGGVLTQLRDIGTVLLGAYGLEGSSGGFVFGIYSRKLGDTKHPGPPKTVSHSLTGFRPVNSIVVDDVVRTIKRRQLGRGI